jgi:hypothetical protein
MNYGTINGRIEDRISILQYLHNLDNSIIKKKGYVFIVSIIKYHNLELVKFLYENGADIHVDDKLNKNDLALVQACFSGNISLVKWFIEHGLDIHVINNWHIVRIFSLNNIEMIDFLYNILHFNLRMNNDELFLNAKYYDYLNKKRKIRLLWLCSKVPEYKIILNGSKIIEAKIIMYHDLYLTGKISKMDFLKKMNWKIFNQNNC